MLLQEQCCVGQRGLLQASDRPFRLVDLVTDRAVRKHVCHAQVAGVALDIVQQLCGAPGRQ